MPGDRPSTGQMKTRNRGKIHNKFSWVMSYINFLVERYRTKTKIKIALNLFNLNFCFKNI